MLRKVGAGLVAGLAAGVVFGLMLQVMTVLPPDGRVVPMILRVAALAGSHRLLVGWLVHLGVSVLLGALFGLLLPARASSGTAVALGWLYGVAWWVVGGLVVMPLAMGLGPFAPLQSLATAPAALGSLVGHLLWGAIVGAGVAWLSWRAPDGPARRPV